MCELFGVCANKRINIKFTWRGFYHSGETQADGWGLSFYPGKSAVTFKQPWATVNSSLARFIRDYKYIKGKIFISHVRHASEGKRLYMNTHPFTREMNGREWVFAHNGTLINYKKKKLGAFRPIGTTDSEYAFCYLLDKIKNKTDTRQAIEDVAIELSQLGGFNFILSDGSSLYAYSHGNALYYLERKPPYHSKANLLDEDFSVSLGDIKGRDEIVAIIATRPLTDENWIKIKPNIVYEFKNGELIYS